MQPVLQELREVIRKAAPKAEETISYGVPTFVLHGNLVHFGNFKKHIGFFPASSGIEAFAQELAGYKTSRGTVQFPHGTTLPFPLIRKIVRYRIAENISRAKRKNVTR